MVWFLFYFFPPSLQRLGSTILRNQRSYYRIYFKSSFKVLPYIFGIFLTLQYTYSYGSYYIDYFKLIVHLRVEVTYEYHFTGSQSEPKIRYNDLDSSEFIIILQWSILGPA